MRYVNAYIIGSILGIISEIIVTKGNHHCVKKLTTQCIRNGIFLNLYGWSAIVITLLLDIFNNIPFILVLSIILINLIECIGGKLSFIMHNKIKTWNYSDDMLPACDGYISVVSSAYFTLLLCMYIIFIYPKLDRSFAGWTH